VQRSLELEKQFVEKNGELSTSESTLKNTDRDLQENDTLTDTERRQKQSDIGELREKIKSLHKQIALLKEKQEKLTIRSPIDGRVVTWNVRDQLLDRPVKCGQNLLEIADPSKDWELEVQMPEKRMGHLAKAATAAAAKKQKLPVTFFLATNPAEKFEGLVEEVERSAEVRGEEGSTVLIRVSFDQKTLRKAIADPKIGASATAKVDCGKRAIGYVWFHDLVDFVRAKILFRINL
jgi:hypothetical protein